MAKKMNYSEQIIKLLNMEKVEERLRKRMLYPAIIVSGISKDSKESDTAAFFEFNVPCGTISIPLVREAMLCIEVPAGVSDTLNFAFCKAQHLK